MGTGRVIGTRQTGEVSSPGESWEEVGRLVLPPDGHPRLVIWSGEVHAAGPRLTELEVVLGGSAGTRWACTEASLPDAGWVATSGAFLHRTGDPTLAQWRLRSQRAGSQAAARSFRLEAFDIEGIPFAIDEVVQEQVELGPGETRTLRSSGPVPVPASKILVVPTIEMQPQTQAKEFARFELWADGHRIYGEELSAGGAKDLYLSRAPMVWDQVDSGVCSWQLRVSAGASAPCRVRRAGLFAIDWDALMAAKA